MKTKRQRKISYFFKYVMSIFSWTFFGCLVVFCLLLGYYFCANKIYEKKGYEYAPAFSLYTIVSPSMVPTINVYDLVVNFKVASPAHVMEDDIITFKSPSKISKGMMITHRVYDVQIVNGEYQYVTKGDNNQSIDPTPANYKNIVGKTAFKVPGFGKVQKFINSLYGWLFIIVIPAIVILFLDMSKLSKLNRVKRMSKQANKELVSRVQNGH